MPAYLVRLIETRDLVGIFVADDEDDVRLAVDPCTDVPYCEYIELPNGAVMWEDDPTHRGHGTFRNDI